MGTCIVRVVAAASLESLSFKLLADKLLDPFERPPRIFKLVVVVVVVVVVTVAVAGDVPVDSDSSESWTSPRRFEFPAVVGRIVIRDRSLYIYIYVYNIYRESNILVPIGLTE